MPHKFKVGDKVRRASKTIPKYGGFNNGDVTNVLDIRAYGYNTEPVHQILVEYPTRGLQWSGLDHWELVGHTLEDRLAAAEGEVARIKGLIEERDQPKVGDHFVARTGPVGYLEILSIVKDNEYVVLCRADSTKVGSPFVMSVGPFLKTFKKLAPTCTAETTRGAICSER